MSVKLTGSHDYYGKGKASYVARLTGRDSKWTFSREFLAKGQDRRDAVAEVIEPGLYEVRNVDKKERVTDEYVIVLEDADGDLEQHDATKADAMKITKLLDERRAFDAIVGPTDDGWEYVTRRKAEAAAVAQTIDAATEACWDALKTMPEAQAKKVLAALRVRCSPPKPKAAEPLPAETPVGVVSDHAQEQGTTEGELGLTPTPTLPETSPVTM
jgi:hypothetical protein